MTDCPVCHLPEPQHHMSCYAPRVPKRRFSDMSLTEDEVLAILERRCSAKSSWWFPGCDVAATEWRLWDRAKRLLPLWRAVGLKRLKDEGRAEGYVCGVGDARFGRF